MREQSAKPDRFVANLAARQHGVVSVAQLRERGIGRSGVSRRLEAGRFHRVHRGVYAVGHERLTFAGRCMAAALACGPGAAISHLSAGVLWGMLYRASGAVEVTIATANGRKPQVGISIHRSAALGPQNVTRQNGVPITTPMRTLRDLRRIAPHRLYLRAVRRALDLGLISEADLRSEEEMARSELERRFIALCRRHRIPTPLVNAKVGRFEVDFLWIDHRLAVEADSFKHHRNRAAFEADRARDAQLQALGYRVLRFTWRQVTDRPSEVVGPMREVMRS